MAYKPTRERLVVKILPASTVSKGGIVIPDSASAEDTTAQGEVIAVGQGRLNDNDVEIPMSVKTGDRVLFNQTAGQTVKVDGEELRILKEDDVLATIE